MVVIQSSRTSARATTKRRGEAWSYDASCTTRMAKVSAFIDDDRDRAGVRAVGARARAGVGGLRVADERAADQVGRSAARTVVGG